MGNEVGTRETGDEASVLPEDSRTEESALKLDVTLNKKRKKNNKKLENFDMSLTPEAEGFRGSGREENLIKGLTRRFLFPKKHSKISQGRSPGLGHPTPWAFPFFQTVTQGQTSPLTVAGPRRIRTGFPNTLSWFT